MCLPNSVQVILKTNWQRWDSNPRAQSVLEEQTNTLTTQGPPCLSRESKKNVSLQIEYFFLLKIKNLSNQAPVRSKKDLRSVYLKCDDEFSTLVLDFQTISFCWNFKFFKATCYSFQTIRGSILKFIKIPLFECFKYRNVEHWPIDFFMKNTKFCHCLIAWLFCLDEFDKFASQFYLQIFVI